MNKKSFKDNPALQFISTPGEPSEKLSPEINEKIAEVPSQAAKLKLNPIYLETKSKRVQLLMQPTLHTQLSRLAKKKNVSFNELVHKALEQFITEY